MTRDDRHQAGTLVIACGAIAHELVTVTRASGFEALDIQCLPAEWHNTPDRIAPAVEEKLLHAQGHYAHVFVAYGDCGTGGQLDSVLRRFGVERLPGDHCYSFFAGQEVFNNMAEEELGTFYLTDYLLDNFNRLILDGLGITRHPELLEQYFGHYTRLMYLAQDVSQRNRAEKAAQAAQSLGLTLEIHNTGLAPFKQSLGGIPIATA